MLREEPFVPLGHRTASVFSSNRMTEVALIIEVDATASALADRAMAE
jgi:hypothetical protein